MNRLIALIGCFVLLALPAGGTDTRNLPQLGDRTSAIISLEDEHQLGQEFLRSLRAQVPTISDPLLQDYLEHLIYRLALNSELQDRRLELIIIDARVINAFAAPGGVVGIHNGLLLQADTEDEFAAVLAHELAHLSQRHFARQGDAGRQSSIPGLAGMLAGIVLMATTGANAGIAAITAGQALSQDQILRFSRSWEAEADRIGIETLAASGMDPRSMAYMFEQLARASRFDGSDIPEFVMTHPVTKDRIADSYNQAQQYPKKEYPQSLDYQMMRSRTIVKASRTLSEAVARMEQEMTSSDPVLKTAARYGLVLALTESLKLDRAAAELNILKQSYPDKFALTLADSDIQVRAERYDDAGTILKAALNIAPNNYPLTMAYADVLLKSRKPREAERLLVPLTLQRPNDADLWYLMAETYGLANNIVGVHEARAEYFVLVGNLDQAMTQLGYALPLVRDNFQMKARIQARIEVIHAMRKKQRQ